MMKNSFRKWLSFVLCAVLIAAMALVATGCKPTVQDGETVIHGGETLGTGSKTFTFNVVDTGKFAYEEGSLTEI